MAVKPECPPIVNVCDVCHKQIERLNHGGNWTCGCPGRVWEPIPAVMYVVKGEGLYDNSDRVVGHEDEEA